MGGKEGVSIGGTKQRVFANEENHDKEVAEGIL